MDCEVSWGNAESGLILKKNMIVLDDGIEDNITVKSVVKSEKPKLKPLI